MTTTLSRRLTQGTDGPMTPERAGAVADQLIARITKENFRRYALFLTPDGIERIGPEDGKFVAAWRRMFPDSCVGVYNGDCVREDVVADLLEMARKHVR
jgi:hypothetical protein